MSNGEMGFTKHKYYGIKACLEEVALTTSQEVILDTRGFNVLDIDCDLVWAAASDVSLQIETSHDQATFRPLQGLQGTATLGTYESGDFRITKTVGATARWTWRIEVNCNFVKLTFSATGATTDKFSVGVNKGVV